MPRAVFESTIPVFERSKTVRALNRAVIGAIENWILHIKFERRRGRLGNTMIAESGSHVVWVPVTVVLNVLGLWMENATSRYGRYLRIYWINSRGQSVRGGTPDGVLKIRHNRNKNNLLRKVTWEHGFWQITWNELGSFWLGDQWLLFLNTVMNRRFQ
jgi:hypothetical protein